MNIFERRSLLGIFMGLVLAAIGVGLTLWLGLLQFSTGKETNDRQAGRIGAKFEFVKVLPFPTDVKEFYEEIFPFGGTVAPRFKSVDELMAFNPRVVVKNNGDENIEEVRIEVQRVFSVSVNPTRAPGDNVFVENPLGEPTEIEKFVLSEKLRPGESATVPYGRAFLRDIMRVQNPEKKDWKHVAKYEVRCYGRAVGATAFDVAERRDFSWQAFAWLPSGFSEEKCKKYLDMTPTAKIGQPGKPIGMRP